MKRKISYEYNKKILTFIQVLLLAVSLLIFSLLLFLQAEKNVEFMELVQTDLTFNILYLLSMFDGILFFEVFYFRKKLEENMYFESVMLCLLLIGIAQLLLCNLFVALVIFYFIYNTLKTNQLKLKKLYSKAKDNEELSVVIGNVILFGFFIVYMYILILKRFALI